jgi:hypothetical protein
MLWTAYQEQREHAISQMRYIGCGSKQNGCFGRKREGYHVMSERCNDNENVPKLMRVELHRNHTAIRISACRKSKVGIGSGIETQTNDMHYPDIKFAWVEAFWKALDVDECTTQVWREGHEA